MVYEIRKSFLFYLDTRYRSGGTLSRPVFTFPNNLIVIEDEKIRLTLNEMSMEYTFYQTEQYNNKFLLIENGVNRIIEIEIGNYNLVTFLNELTIKLNISFITAQLKGPVLPLVLANLRKCSPFVFHIHNLNQVSVFLILLLCLALVCLSLP